MDDPVPKPARVTSWETTQQVVRIFLQILSGALVSRGVIDAEITPGIVGLGISIASMIWWAITDHQRKALVAEAKAARKAREAALMSQ